jgi:large subunit ribosomal protein L32
MPLPKQRHNQSRGARRRAGHRKLEAKQLVVCSHCGLSIMPHRVCGYCGYYKDKAILENKISLKTAK